MGALEKKSGKIFECPKDLCEAVSEFCETSCMQDLLFGVLKQRNSLAPLPSCCCGGGVSLIFLANAHKVHTHTHAHSVAIFPCGTQEVSLSLSLVQYRKSECGNYANGGS